MPTIHARTAAVAVATAAVIALAGCTHDAKTTPTPSSSQSASSQTAVPSPTPTPTDPPAPVMISCDQLLTADQVYAFNPNFGADPGYKPKADSLEKKIADWKGVTCAWKNQSSGEVIQIAVAQPPASQMESLKNDAVTAAQPVPTYGAPPLEGYFKPGDVGQVQIFTGTYWIVAESTAFFEPGDAAPLMANVLANIGA